MIDTKQLVLLVLLGASFVLAQDAGRSNGDTPEQSYPHCSSQKFNYGGCHIAYKQQLFCSMLWEIITLIITKQTWKQQHVCSSSCPMLLHSCRQAWQSNS
jgi:hypothetical protein